jgi:hypothetical protein
MPLKVVPLMLCDLYVRINMSAGMFTLGAALILALAYVCLCAVPLLGVFC